MDFESTPGSAATPGLRLIETIPDSSDEAKESQMLAGFVGRMLAYPTTVFDEVRISRAKFLAAVLDGPERFRHIAAHGDENGFYIGARRTHVGVEHFAAACSTGPLLQNRFLTVSACSKPTTSLWEALHEVTGVEGIVAPMGSVWFCDAALFFTSLYYSLALLPSIRRRVKTEERLIDFIDCFQRAKASSLALGVRGAFRLICWENGTRHIIV
ncbi:MAG: hypothetical protein H6702_18510 [Myxococcales bacterium]|nr:hypothetical protein [Myxococcales bacterium]